MPRTCGRSCVAALLAILLYAAAAACQSNPSPAPMPSVAPSPSRSVASSTPSPMAPTMPAEARGTSAESAKAFVRYYFDQINYAMRTGDTESLDGLSTQNCVSCRAIARNVRQTYETGARIESEGWRLTVISLVPEQPREHPILDLGVVQAPEVIVLPSGDPGKKYSGGKQPMTAHLVWRHNHWIVERLDLVT